MDYKELRKKIFELRDNFQAEYDCKIQLANYINPEKNKKYVMELTSISELISLLDKLAEDNNALKRIIREKATPIELVGIERIDSGYSDQILEITPYGVYVTETNEYMHDWNYSIDYGLESRKDIDKRNRKRYVKIR